LLALHRVCHAAADALELKHVHLPAGGRSIACAILDEVAFWRDENSSSPYLETYSAIIPGLATIPGSMLIGVSSPYRRAGLLHQKWRDHYGKADDDVLVIRAPSRVLNPTLDPRIIDDALARDPAAARAEWLAEWRDDVSTFVSRDLIEAAVDRGVLVRPPVAGVSYRAFCDPSGGVSDSFTCGIAHREGELAVLDCLLEIAAPFNVATATGDVATTLKSYGLSEVTGDRYAASWVVAEFSRHGVMYRHSERDRSAIYADALPLFTSGRARLLDNCKMISQFASLERRTSSGGRDRIDHPERGHDDVANSAAGALVMLSCGALYTGFLDWMARELDARSRGEAAPAVEYVEMRAPPQVVGVAHGLGGRRYAVDTTGVCRVHPDDAVAFGRNGWIKIEVEVHQPCAG
jgi:hypothetical protein